MDRMLLRVHPPVDQVELLYGCAAASALTIPRRVGVLDLPSALRVGILRDGVKGAAGDAGCDPKMFCVFCMFC